MKRKATAIWKGTGLEGSGVLSTQSGAFKDLPYSFTTRFKNEDGTAGTNPEELIAAAHAGCFSMALSFQISNAGFEPKRLHTEAVLQMEKEEIGWTVKQITLNLEGEVPGMDESKFLELAENAKKNCPVSRLLNCEIHLNPKLV